jgi:catechol 2,3-dioxygenase-like lactoylglutathione lyase family enzyme
MTSWVNGISAITVFQEDLGAAKAFYQTIFELPVYHEDDDSVVFQFGGTLVNLLKTSAADELIQPGAVGDKDSGHRIQFTVSVDDVDRRCEKLSRIGVQLLNGPMDRPWGVRTASFQDPGGHIWELAH